MKKAILKRFLAVLAVALLICGSVSCVFMGQYEIKKSEQDMLYLLRLMDYTIDYESGDLQAQINALNPVTMEDNTRITVVDLEGKVLADTSVNANQTDNHLGREEIEDALNTGFGAAQRYSKTLKMNMMYVSFLSQKGDYVLRLSIPYQGAWVNVRTILPAVLLSIVVAFIISVFFARRFSKSVTEPLTEISAELVKIQDQNHVLHFNHYEYEELNDIVTSTGKLSDKINKTVTKLKYERNKVDYILDSMSEGFILLNENQEVMTLNQAAKKILNYEGNAEYKNIVHYTQNMNIINGIQQAVDEGEIAVFDIISTDNRLYSAHISTVRKGIFNENTSGIVILLIDVTADRQAQQMRQEFFSNVSHELKTPITSIQGFAELLGDGIVTDEARKKEFLQRIKKETQNMTNLINDILMISRLETKTVDENILPVRVKPIIQEVVNSLSPLAQQSQVTVHWKSDEIVVNANAQQIHQLVNNLTANAIKYNKEKGSVMITAREKSGQFCLNVSDTGIGIPPDSQQRIFERFFRVDKGRSRKMGGTGLGLSIVKHIVNFYNGTIQLESRMGAGTSITVQIPL